MTYFDSNQVNVFYGLENGTFQDAYLEAPPGGLGYVSGLVTTDLNHDGRSDLTAVLVEPNEVRVQLGLDGGGFADPATVALATRGVPLHADLDGDGTPDLAVVDSRGEVLLRSGRANQKGAFDPPVVVNPGFPSRDIGVVDTGHGILLASVDALDNAVSLFLLDHNGPHRVGVIPTGPLPAQLVVGDLDGGGKADDLVVRYAMGDTLSVYNDVNGPATFTARPVGPYLPVPTFLTLKSVYIGPGISDVSLVDLDRDGRPDIVATGKVAADVRVLRNVRRPGVHACPHGPARRRT